MSTDSGSAPVGDGRHDRSAWTRTSAALSGTPVGQTGGQRCEARNEAGEQCGNYRGHGGWHTSLIASDFLVVTPSAPVADAGRQDADAEYLEDFAGRYGDERQKLSDIERLRAIAARLRAEPPAAEPSETLDLEYLHRAAERASQPVAPASGPDAWGVEVYSNDEKRRIIDHCDISENVAQIYADEYRDALEPRVVPLWRAPVAVADAAGRERVAQAIYETDNVPSDYRWAELTEDVRAFWYRCADKAIAALAAPAPAAAPHEHPYGMTPEEYDPTRYGPVQHTTRETE
jgi:hypothetical protein